MNRCKVSIVIRTLNEGRFLGEVLRAINDQNDDEFEVTVVVVDSGSTDNTLEIAKQYDADLIEIEPEFFTFGGALNVGFEFSKKADVVVSLSGHCIPVDKNWIKYLLDPIINKQAELTFGKQSAPDFVRTSERNYFYSKYKLMQQGYIGEEFFNNGNSAVRLDVWEKHKYDENLNAQEDIEFAVRVGKHGARVFYEPKAEVIHVHDDTNIKVYKRLVREIHTELLLEVKSRTAVLLSVVKMPMLVFNDAHCAYQKCLLAKAIKGIVGFRVMQMCASVVALYRSYIY